MTRAAIVRAEAPLPRPCYPERRRYFVRWVIVLALVCSVAGCRKAQPTAAPEPAQTAEPAQPPTAPAAADPAPAGEPAPAAGPAASADAPPAPARAAAPDPGKGPEAAAQPPARAAPPLPDLGTMEVAAGDTKKDEPDNRIYRWVDREGAIHYGSIDDVPADRRKSARVVDSGVTVVESQQIEAPASSSTRACPSPAPCRTPPLPGPPRPQARPRSIPPPWSAAGRRICNG
jgi:hypothetical protein